MQSKQAGTYKIFTLEGTLAAALGANLPVWESAGSMIVDIGGETTETAVLSLNGIVTSEFSKVAGQAMDEAIIRYIQKTHHLMVGSQTAETIKIEIGSAFSFSKTEREREMTVGGRDLLTGCPRKVCITAGEVEEALSDSIVVIIDTIKSTLEKTPPELSADIMDRGIVMAGGGALLKNLDKVISWTTKIPVSVAENPLDCVAIGTGKAWENINRTKQNRLSL